MTVTAAAPSTATPTDEPQVFGARPGEEPRLRLAGSWTIAHSAVLEAAGAALERAGVAAAQGARSGLTLDLSGVAALDTAGAWLVDRARARLEARGVPGISTIARGGPPTYRHRPPGEHDGKIRFLRPCPRRPARTA